MRKFYSKEKVNKKILTLERLMRQGWDRRVDQEYRYWMSDGVSDDSQMWESGRRDLEILTKHYRDKKETRTCLEIGCGVGRLLRPAAAAFKYVIGVDVSSSAIVQAERLLSDLSNVQLVRGSGSSLSTIRDSSIDFSFSFAAFGHMPVCIMVPNLLEINRVLRIGGSFSLQFYLGPIQGTVEEDSFTIRSYPEESLGALFEQAGFEMQAIEELQLPFDATDHQSGMVPHILSGKKVSEARSDGDDLIRSLLPTGEAVATEDWPGSFFEYRMAVTRVHQLVAEQRFEEAKTTLEFILETYSNPEPGVLRVLEELNR